MTQFVGEQMLTTLLNDYSLHLVTDYNKDYQTIITSIAQSETFLRL